MKHRFLAVAAAICMLPVLPLTGCTEGGTYETEHFRFTVNTSWYLESAWDLEDNNYRGGMAGPEYEFLVNNGYYVRVYERQTNRSVTQNDRYGTPIDCTHCSLPAAGYVESEGGLNRNGTVCIADQNNSGVQLVLTFTAANAKGYGRNWDFPDDVQYVLGTVEQIKDHEFTGGEIRVEGVTLRYTNDWKVETGLSNALFKITLASAQSDEEADSRITLEKAPDGYNSARAYLNELAETYKNRKNTKLEPISESRVSGYQTLCLCVAVEQEDGTVLCADTFVFDEGGRLYLMKVVSIGYAARERISSLISGALDETLSFTFPEKT